MKSLAESILDVDDDIDITYMWLENFINEASEKPLKAGPVIRNICKELKKHIKCEYVRNIRKYKDSDPEDVAKFIKNNYGDKILIFSEYVGDCSLILYKINKSNTKKLDYQASMYYTFREGSIEYEDDAGYSNKISLILFDDNSLVEFYYGNDELLDTFASLIKQYSENK